eukprot:533962-Prymnesium_polylepis.2
MADPPSWSRGLRIPAVSRTRAPRVWSAEAQPKRSRARNVQALGEAVPTHIVTLHPCTRVHLTIPGHAHVHAWPQSFRKIVHGSDDNTSTVSARRLRESFTGGLVSTVSILRSQTIATFAPPTKRRLPRLACSVHLGVQLPSVALRGPTPIRIALLLRTDVLRTDAKLAPWDTGVRGAPSHRSDAPRAALGPRFARPAAIGTGV